MSKKPEIKSFVYLALAPWCVLAPIWLLLFSRVPPADKLRITSIVVGAPFWLAKTVFEAPFFVDKVTLFIMGGCLPLLLVVLVFSLAGAARRDMVLVLTAVFIYGCTAIYSMFFLFVVHVGANGV